MRNTVCDLKGTTIKMSTCWLRECFTVAYCHTICKAHSFSLSYWGTEGTGIEAAVKNFPMAKEVSGRAEHQTCKSDFKPSAPLSIPHCLLITYSICHFLIDERLLYRQGLGNFSSFLEFDSSKFCFK